jgi:hypothetical protein
MKAMKLAALTIGAGIVSVASSSGSVFAQPAVDVAVSCGARIKTHHFSASPVSASYNTKAIQLCGRTYYISNNIYINEWSSVCKRGGEVRERGRTICSW